MGDGIRKWTEDLIEEVEKAASTCKRPSIRLYKPSVGRKDKTVTCLRTIKTTQRVGRNILRHLLNEQDPEYPLDKIWEGRKLKE